VAAFLDTNVLVYAFDRRDERKRATARALLADASANWTISSQVLSEFFWVVTRKLSPTVPESVAEEAVNLIAAQMNVVAVDALLVTSAVAIARSHKLALWDAQLLAAARRANSLTILTEDLGHGAVLAGVTVVDPFRT